MSTSAGTGSAKWLGRSLAQSLCPRQAQPPRKLPLLPERIDGRDHHQGEQRCAHHASHHRVCDAFHDIRPGPFAPENRREAADHRRDGHDQGTYPEHRTLGDCLGQVPALRHPAAGPARPPRLIQLDQHDDAGFGRHSRQRDEPDRDCHAQVVMRRPHEPHPAHQRKGKREHHDRTFGHAAEIEIEQQQDDADGDGNHDPERAVGALHRLVLARPFQPVSGRERQSGPEQLLGLRDVAAHVAACTSTYTTLLR